VARLKAALLQAAARSCIYESFTHLPEYCRLAANWASREPDVVAKVDTVLAAGGVTRDEVMAKTLAWKLDEFERIDRMIAGCEARRNVALREIDGHRATLAAALRQRPRLSNQSARRWCWRGRAGGRCSCRKSNPHTSLSNQVLTVRRSGKLAFRGQKLALLLSNWWCGQ
jgi:hypothetical protein